MLDMDTLAEEIAAIVSEEVERATSPLFARIKQLEDRPMPERGEPGKDGQDGERGADGRDGIDGERGADGQDGRDGVDGRDGEPGQPGEKGRDGLDGKDGAGIADLVIDRAGNLVATFTDGRMKELGQVVGRDGRDGEKGADGRDGFSLDQFDTKWDGDRLLTLSFSNGETEYTHQLQMPIMLYRGVWQEGRDYSQGDTVTWGGSLWHANKATAGKPDAGDWTLCAKKGRDAKDAR